MTAKNAFHIILNMNDSANKKKNTRCDILEQRVHYNILYDFYSPLLTDRQRKVYEAICFSDYSFTEAAELFGISKQAVSIIVRNVMKKLDSLESKLHFSVTVEKLEAKIKKLESKEGKK
ncbi:MAG: hypothetical protein IJR94_08000 [Synergistaceae bacterium]|nr:hypothetical protein [Synergistaceae bacterium]